MLTRWGEALDKENVLQEYPRPQMKRDSFLNLNGLWNYAISSQAVAPSEGGGEILVPFSPESVLSGVSRTLLEFFCRNLIIICNTLSAHQQESID